MATPVFAVPVCATTTSSSASKFLTSSSNVTVKSTLVAFVGPPASNGGPPDAGVIVSAAGGVRSLNVFRMRWFTESAMKISPSGSTVRLVGSCSCALVAGPPSPLKPDVPIPATVEMNPLRSTIRTRALRRSAIKRLPALSNAMPVGFCSCALVARPPSPLNPGVPVPATVVMTPLVFTIRTRALRRSAIKRLPALSNAIPVGFCSCALVAWPSSPPKLGSPVPAKVVMMPSVSTLRTRWF